MDISSEQLEELNEFYWETDISTKELQAHFGLPKPVHVFISPLAINEECPNCSALLSYKSRTSRSQEEKACRSCGHTSRSLYSCRCFRCMEIKKEENQRRTEEHRKYALEAYEIHKDKVTDPDYVQWALSKLPRRHKLFLKATVEVVNEDSSPTWEDICDRAGVVSHQSYVRKLTQLGLLLDHPDGKLFVNPELSSDVLGVEESVRKISNSLRFDVFQRDKHTCQYCGRRPPEARLEIDHLIPVAKGGTDDFLNLVTSCRECNSGKSAKLIKQFTGGHTKEEWRERTKERRSEALRNRREQIDEVIHHWSECRNGCGVSEYETSFIYNFVELYNPEWIKAAVSIATRNPRNNYARYTAAVLRNWAKDGPPEHVDNPDAALEETLRQKKASPKQIDYVSGLLDKLGLTLEESYCKADFEDLTMLDARKLIEALTESEKPRSKHD